MTNAYEVSDHSSKTSWKLLENLNTSKTSPWDQSPSEPGFDL